jgi:SpoVK/Ycf46/Vps4 family AAA+-type ATPase
MSENIRDLELLVLSRTPILAIESPEEERVRRHVESIALRQQMPWFEWKTTLGLKRAGLPDPMYDTRNPSNALRTVLEMQVEGLFLFHDLQKYFEDPAILRALRDIGHRFAEDRRCVILCAPDLPVPPELRTTASLIRLELPDYAELKELTLRTLKDLGAPRRIRIELSVPEIEQLVQSLRGLTLQEAQRALLRAALDDLKLTRADLRHIQNLKKALIARDGVLDLHPPDASLQQVGGLDALKSWLRTRGQAFSAEAARYGLEPPRGVLLLGVQGCGKSLTAKAIAAEWGLPLLRLDAGALYDKFVGESERNLRRGLQTAEAMAPCVLWIDEIEKGMSGREGSASDGGLSRRLFGTFVSWLQERRAPVFVAATANDITALPPELLRKGRFDEIFFVDLPAGAARRSIFAVHLARRRQEPGGFDLQELSRLADGFSGAEIEAAVVTALYHAFAERQPLGMDHLRQALRSTIPLSRTFRESIEALRAWARGRAVPADDARAAAPPASA